MPLPSRRKSPGATSAPAAKPALDRVDETVRASSAGYRPPGLPRRIAVVVIVKDDSGSMRLWRKRQGEFIPAVARRLMDTAGPRAVELVYVLYAVVSGGMHLTEFTPISRAAEPDYEPDGETQIGGALAAVADKWEAFFAEVFKNETTVRSCDVLVCSDLHPTGESGEETRAGVEKFIETVRKYRAAVTIVSPDEASTNMDLARRLDVKERGVRYLDSDPDAVLDVAFDSLLQASRKVTGSKPGIGRM